MTAYPKESVAFTLDRRRKTRERDQDMPRQKHTVTKSFSNLRVLIVDDLPTNRKVLQLLVKKFGAQTQSCSSGEEALELLSSEEFDLILLDLHMPTMSGFEVGERIVASRSGKLPYLVAQTADETVQACDRTREIGFDAHLTKPIRPVKVSEILERINDLSASI